MVRNLVLVRPLLPRRIKTSIFLENQRVSVGWRFCPGELIISGFVIEVGQKLVISGPPLLRLLKTSIFPRKSMGAGWRFRPAKLIICGIVIEVARNLVLFAQRFRVSFKRQLSLANPWGFGWRFCRPRN